MKRSRNTSRPSIRKALRTSSTVALLTDFGTSDHYVGVVKGVILSVNPSATIVDITHEVQPQRIRQAGYLLWVAYRFFPIGAVFLAIVDPGVGTKRRILAVRTSKYIFLAPDNMLLDFVLSQEKILEAVEVKIDNSPYVLSPVSHTFHGRDIFAPVAAYLSSGISLNEIGKRITLHPAISPFVDGSGAASESAEILHIDHFGNLITSIRARKSSRPTLVINRTNVNTWTTNYVEAPEHVPCLIAGSSGLVEIIVKNGSAEESLKANIGDKILIRWK